MNAPKHTPEPWFVGAQNDTLYIIDRRPNATMNDYPNHDADVEPIAKVYDTVRDVRLSGDANAARIVACVNACEGVANGDLHAGGVVVAQRELIRRGELMAKAADDLDAIRAQRDELAAALHALLAESPNQTIAGDAARAALAKLEGKP